MKTQTKTIYFAGELFSLKHLAGNAMLAQAINRQSAGTYRCIVPQDLEQRETTSQAIRDQDIRSVIACDVALFNFDGTEIDSGTVVEFMLAKFADIPSVILRSDFRSGGDQRGDPWNLMLSGFPRTEVLLLDAIAAYQAKLTPGLDATDALQKVFHAVATDVLAAFSRAEAQSSRLAPELRPSVYEWLRMMPGEIFSAGFSSTEVEQILRRKIDCGLLS